jgi:hypothetical protein
MNIRNCLTAGAALTALLALGACETIKQTYNLVAGTDQSLGDDTVRRAPLTLPPDFNLRPPATGPGVADISPAVTARQAVFGLDKEAGGGTVVQRGGMSMGESALLTHAGSTKVSPKLRDKVDAETQAINQQEQAFTQTLLHPPEKKQEDSGFLGTLFGSGDNSPTIDRRGGNGDESASDSGSGSSSGFLGGLFGWL